MQVSLQLVDRTIHLLAEGDTVELVEHGLMEALRRFRWFAGSWSWCGVMDVLHREVELVFVPLGVATILAATIGEQA
jgi:hypothetical protein